MAALTPPQDNDGIVELTDLIERGPYAPDDRTTQPDAGSEAPGSAAPDVSFSGEKPGDAPRAHEEASEDSRRAAEDQGEGSFGGRGPDLLRSVRVRGFSYRKENLKYHNVNNEVKMKIYKQNETPEFEMIRAAAPEEETASTSPAGTPGQAIREQQGAASQQSVSPLVTGMLPGIADKVGGIMEKVFHMEDRLRDISERLVRMEHLRTAQALPDANVVESLVQKETARLVAEAQQQYRTGLEGLKERMDSLEARLASAEQGNIGEEIRQSAEKALDEKLSCAGAEIESRTAKLASSLDARVASAIESGNTGAGQHLEDKITALTATLEHRISEAMDKKSGEVQAALHTRTEQALMDRATEVFDSLNTRLTEAITSLRQEASGLEQKTAETISQAEASLRTARADLDDSLSRTIEEKTADLDRKISESIDARLKKLQEGAASQELTAGEPRLSGARNARLSDGPETGMEKTGADSGSELDERIAAAVRKQADSLREEFSNMSAKDLESRMDGFREEITAQTRAAADESLRETGDSLRRLAGAISLLEEKIGKIQTEQQHLSDRLTSVENVISGPALEKTAAAACARVLREELARLMSGEK